ncbi:MAG TPA: phosphatidylserine decarboxylase [Pyrinomonadaceae bacterium]|nr:phosphatidylserine decarboxylase [Pyrinomonadaceae bacterium]
MAREGFFYVLIPAIAALLFAAFEYWIIAAILALISAFMAFFFRDPLRIPPEGENLVLAAADGKVTRIERSDDEIIISVFMSPLDVHINRAPVSGDVLNVQYTPGQRRPATNDKASLLNERNTSTISTGFCEVKCTQIAGILARRIVCYLKPGDAVTRGEKIGMIKFSSRTDVVVPENSEILVSVGEHVRAGETTLAKLKI